MPAPRGILAFSFPIFWALFVAMCPAKALAQDRRFLSTPGIVVETGARHAACDVLRFTRDGKHLLAAGDDKVVRSWAVAGAGFASHLPEIYRWPIFREQLGCIFALALSPDEGKIAIGGFGLKPGMVAVLDRVTGQVEHVLQNPQTGQVTRELAFSPGGKYVVYGSDSGELFRWDHARGDKGLVCLQTARSGQINRVRLLRFLDKQTFLCLTQDGTIREWDLLSVSGKPRRTFSTGTTSIFRAAMSPDNRWLVTTSQTTSGDRNELVSKVRWVDYRKLQREGEGAEGAKSSLSVPGTGLLFPRAVAFDPASEHLAVGVEEANELPENTRTFARVTGGKVFVYSLKKGWLSRKGMDVGFRIDNIAFRPGSPDQLATAGGPNQEVQLWDYRKETALDTIQSPGSSLWNVTVSKDGKYLGWKERLNTNPLHPNERGAGPWRVFPLLGPSRAITSPPPNDFVPTKALRSWGGWSVVPSENGFLWSVRNPAGTLIPLDEKSKLYFPRVSQLPRCYAFIPPPAGSKAPPRLAIGHQWGASIYELRDGAVRLVRVLMGHEGEVTSLVPSADGRLLFTSSRDQTIACWSLVNWPGQGETGLHLSAADGKLLVKKVELGSLAWELGLTDGDEIVMVVSPDVLTTQTGIVFDPYNIGLAKYKLRIDRPQVCDLPTIMARLARAQAWRQYIFVWRHKGKEEIGVRRVQQRPLWRFYPTRKENGSDWILWRWRDFYYDASENADRLVGWHVNGKEVLTDTPRYHPLEHFRGRPAARGEKAARSGFHNPAKVWPTVEAAFQAPEKVQLADVEPPTVTLTLQQAPLGKNDLVVRVQVRPQDPVPAGQRVTRVTLWLDDSVYDVPLTIQKDGTVDERPTIPQNRLRNGGTVLRVVAFNAAGGRGESTPLSVAFTDVKRARPELYAVCVGITDYGKVNAEFRKVAPRRQIKNLPCASGDAAELAGVLRQHKGSALFEKVHVEHISDQKATATNVAAAVERLGKKAGPDDLFVLFLAGHGSAVELSGAKGKNRIFEPETFFYVCADSDYASQKRVLTAEQLRGLLQPIKCRKLILLDACHSGAMSSPTRALNSEGAKFIIFSACQPHQQALEPPPEDEVLKNGFFTHGLLSALVPARLGTLNPRKQKVTVQELSESIKRTIEKDRLRYIDQDPPEQTPVFIVPEAHWRSPILCRP